MERKVWSQSEDRILRDIIEIKNIKKWSSIARMMEVEYGVCGRTGKQCRERWHNKLNPDINGDEWDPAEEQLLFHYHDLHGNKWARIAQYLPRRSDNCIKNHFYSTLRKAFRGVNRYITEKKRRTEQRPFKKNMLSKIILLAEESFKRTLAVDQEEIDNCVDLKKKLVEYVISRGEHSDASMDALVESINKLTKGLVVKKPKKKRRLYMDIDSSEQRKLRLATENKETSLSVERHTQNKSVEVKEEEVEVQRPIAGVQVQDDAPYDYMSKQMLFQQLPFLGFIKSQESFPMQMSQSTLDCAQSYIFAQHFNSCGFLPASTTFLSMTSPQLQPEPIKEKMGFQPYNHQSQLLRPNFVTMGLGQNLIYSQPLPKPASQQ